MRRIYASISSIVLGIIGLSIALYLYEAASLLYCSPFYPGGCDRVIVSRYSEVHGIHLSLLGAIWFLGIILFSVISIFRKRFTIILYGWSLISIPSVIVLVWIEIFLLNAICVYCTVDHVLGLAQVPLAYIIKKSA